MDKIIAAGELFSALKDFFTSISDSFSGSIPNNFYEMMNKMAFLTSEILSIDSNGKIFDKSYGLATSITNLANIVIWGILIFYGFKSMFAYFISKKPDIPWKFFIRMIVFGILANSSFFICYTGIFFAENFTEYLRRGVGEYDISFNFLEECTANDELNCDEEKSIYDFDVLISVFLYFFTFFTALCLGGRFILIKVLILISPIFFVFGGFKESEKLFVKWCKTFAGLIFFQILICIILGVSRFCSFGDILSSKVFACALLLLSCKSIVNFFKLSS